MIFFFLSFLQVNCKVSMQQMKRDFRHKLVSTQPSFWPGGLHQPSSTSCPLTQNMWYTADIFCGTQKLTPRREPSRNLGGTKIAFPLKPFLNPFEFYRFFLNVCTCTPYLLQSLRRSYTCIYWYPYGPCDIQKWPIWPFDWPCS